MLAADDPKSRSHPDITRDVWELSVWDPTPLTLKLFCLFSPGHVLVYWLCLPTSPSDSRPSVTVISTMTLVGLLSLQLMVLQAHFSQQSKDTSVIHKEVLNEYDNKFVHPRTQPTMRDVGIQCSSVGSSARSANSVDTYTPTVILNRGFRIHPNPNYVKHLDQDGKFPQSTPFESPSRAMPPLTQTSAPLQDNMLRRKTAFRQPQPNSNEDSRSRDGGSLGIYSHANSPLRKSSSTDLYGARRDDRNSSPVKREGSPLKRASLAPNRPLSSKLGPSQGNPVTGRGNGRI